MPPVCLRFHKATEPFAQQLCSSQGPAESRELTTGRALTAGQALEITNHSTTHIVVGRGTPQQLAPVSRDGAEHSLSRSAELHSSELPSLRRSRGSGRAPKVQDHETSRNYPWVVSQSHLLRKCTSSTSLLSGG